MEIKTVNPDEIKTRVRHKLPDEIKEAIENYVNDPENKQALSIKMDSIEETRALYLRLRNSKRYIGKIKVSMNKDKVYILKV